MKKPKIKLSKKKSISDIEKMFVKKMKKKK